MPTILGANSVSGYEISNSLRSNYEVDLAYLQRTGGSNTGRNKLTYSTWIKRSVFGGYQEMFTGYNSENYMDIFYWGNDETLRFYGYRGNTQTMYGITNRRFRDPAAWYHLVMQVDTTDGTAADRVKLYINGVRETSFSTYAAPSQNLDLYWNSANPQRVGIGQYTDKDSLGGYMAEIHQIDDAVVAPTEFGEVDNNGEWVPKKYEGSYGTDGFYLEFKQTGTSQNSSGIGADTSGNDNHFAVTNFVATDVTTDTPTNTFCTWNPLDKHSGQTLSEGNTKNVAANSAGTVTSTIGVSEGKWYFEYKVKVVNAQSVFAIPQNLYNRTTDSFQSNYTTGLYSSNPSIYRNGSNVLENVNGTISANDIIMWAMDLDNNNIYFGKGGNWTDGNGFDQSDFANATAYPLTRDSNDSFIVISTHNGASGSSYTLEMNWGNPPYAVSSSNTDGKYGNFEFAPPSGYYALCSKRVAEFG